MKNLRELIKKATPYPMTEQELADAERRLYRFFGCCITFIVRIRI